MLLSITWFFQMIPLANNRILSLSNYSSLSNTPPWKLHVVYMELNYLIMSYSLWHAMIRIVSKFIFYFIDSFLFISNDFISCCIFFTSKEWISWRQTCTFMGMYSCLITNSLALHYKYWLFVNVWVLVVCFVTWIFVIFSKSFLDLKKIMRHWWYDFYASHSVLFLFLVCHWSNLRRNGLWF